MSDITAFNGTVELLKEQAAKCNVSQKVIISQNTSYVVYLHRRIQWHVTFTHVVYMYSHVFKAQSICWADQNVIYIILGNKL